MLFPREGMRRIPFHTVPAGDQWIVNGKPGYLVVSDKNWSSYYSSPPKGSDFATSIYVVASPGVKPNPGYTVSIRQVERVKNQVTIRVELKEPDPRKVHPQVIVHPVAVAELAKVDLEPRGVLDFVFIDQKGRQLAAVKTGV